MREFLGRSARRRVQSLARSGNCRRQGPRGKAFVVGAAKTCFLLKATDLSSMARLAHGHVLCAGVKRSAASTDTIQLLCKTL